jgi:hypothetical protein
MLCRTLRDLLVGRWAIAAYVCLALIGGAATPARVPLANDEPAAMGFRAPEAPLAALATTSAVRFEKQATSVRQTFHKPERRPHLFWAVRVQAIPQQPDVSRASRVLARRVLPPRHLTSHTSDEPGDPFLAQLSLS